MTEHEPTEKQVREVVRAIQAATTTQPISPETEARKFLLMLAAARKAGA